MDTPTLPPFIPRRPIRYRPRAGRAPLDAPAASYVANTSVQLGMQKGTGVIPFQPPSKPPD